VTGTMTDQEELAIRCSLAPEPGLRARWRVGPRDPTTAPFWSDGPSTRAVIPDPDRPPNALGAAHASIANPGAVAGNPDEPANRWLEIDTSSRVLIWHRIDA
jgi:hypothetical protein